LLVSDNEVSPRESLLHEWEVENFEKQAAHAIQIKQLELALKREDNQAKIELKKLEAKWSSWLKLPITLIKLPIYLVMATGYVVAVARKQDVTKNFWEYLR